MSTVGKKIQLLYSFIRTLFIKDAIIDDERKSLWIVFQRGPNPWPKLRMKNNWKWTKYFSGNKNKSKAYFTGNKV